MTRRILFQLALVPAAPRLRAQPAHRQRLTLTQREEIVIAARQFIGVDAPASDEMANNLRVLDDMPSMDTIETCAPSQLISLVLIYELAARLAPLYGSVMLPLDKP